MKRIEFDAFTLLMDEVKDKMSINMNCANGNDHKPTAERNNRVIEENFRACLHGTNCEVTPRIVIQELHETVTARMNVFPAKNGMSLCPSPETIMTQKRLDCDKHCQHEFGSHAQACHQHQKTNSVKERTHI